MSEKVLEEAAQLDALLLVPGCSETSWVCGTAGENQAGEAGGEQVPLSSHWHIQGMLAEQR